MCVLLCQHSRVQTSLGYIPCLVCISAWRPCVGWIWGVSMKEHCQFARPDRGNLMHVLLRHSCGQLGFSVSPHTPFYTHIHYTIQRHALDTWIWSVHSHRTVTGDLNYFYLGIKWGLKRQFRLNRLFYLPYKVSYHEVQFVHICLDIHGISEKSQCLYWTQWTQMSSNSSEILVWSVEIVFPQ